MRKLGLALGFAVAALVTACGGGGGSPGDTHEAYSITLRADKKQLPINIQHYPAGIGAYAPYTTTLYVEAREGSRPIQGGEEIFACNIVQGFESGALYYLDGDEDHEDDDGNCRNQDQHHMAQIAVIPRLHCSRSYFSGRFGR